MAEILADFKTGSAISSGLKQIRMASSYRRDKDEAIQKLEVG